jgi:hypothetical protein
MLPRLGIGVKASTLGLGIEAATAVAARSNIRGSFNFYDYNQGFDDDGIEYAANVNLRSVQITWDQYLAGGFHVSPGILIYNGNHVNGLAFVPSGRSFSLGDATLFSNASDPVRGTASLDVRNVAPMILLGFGNLLPRSDRRFGINFDFGVAFQGSPDLRLSLTGTACAVNPTTACANAATDPIIQILVRQEEDKANDDFKGFKYYPVASLGVSWKF